MKKQSDQKTVIKKTDAVNRLFELNVRAWIREKEVDDNIVLIEGDRNKMDVVLAQLAYFKHVVLANRKYEMEFFTKSKGGISLSLSDMIGKLKTVIKYIVLPDVHPVKPKLKPAEESENMMQKQKEKLKENIFDLRLKNLMNQKKKNILPKLLNDPALLIECTIKHRVKESQSDDATWCTGVVLGIEKHSTNSSLKVVFQVRYEEDIDEYIVFLSSKICRKMICLSKMDYKPMSIHYLH